MYVLIGVVMAVAATLQTAVGFGFNLLAVPVLVFFLGDAEVVVPACHLAWVPIGVLLSVQQRRHISVQRIGWWFVAALPGLVVGVWLLRVLDPALLRRMIGVVAIVSAAFLAWKGSRPFSAEKLWLVGAGAASGVLGGCTAMAGPPVVLLGLNQHWPARPFRADMLVYFTLLSPFAIGMYWWAGSFDLTAVRMAAAALPGLAIGFVVGTALAGYLVGRRYRHAAIVLLCVVGVMPWLR